MSDLPTGWTEVKLEDCVDILDARRVPLNAAERAARVAGKPDTALYPYYGATGLVGQIDAFLFDESLILLGEDGAPFLDRAKQKAYTVQGKCWVNNHAHVLRARKNIADRGFITSYLNCFPYKDFVTGTTRLKLTQAAMRAIPVPLAPLPEQKRIGATLNNLLTKLNVCRERLGRVPEILKKFRKAVLEAAVSGRLTEDWRTAHRVAASWPEETFGSVGDVSGGLTKNAKRVSLKLQRPYLRVANVYASRLELSDVAAIGMTDAEWKKTELRPGDLLIVEGNGSLDQIGRAARWNGELPECSHQNHLIRWRSLGEVDSQFALLWLLSPVGRAALMDLASTSAGLYTLSISKVSKVPIRVPSVREQSEIIRRVTELFNLANSLGRRYSDALRIVGTLTPSVLSKAFRGQLVPQNPNDEPAETLIERIRSTAARAQEESK